MRHGFVCSGLIICVILGAACSPMQTVPSPTEQPAASLPITHEGVSKAPADTITARLNDSHFDIHSEFLLTVSNSTGEPIELSTSLDNYCHTSALWFYAKTTEGWQPVLPLPSVRCLGALRDSSEMIPSGLEKEFDIKFVVFSHAIDFQIPFEELTTYVLGVRYLDVDGQEFFLLTDEFHVGTAAPIDRFDVAVENAPSGAFGFSITNRLPRSLWLAPFCPSTEPDVGWMDKDYSTLQRLTDAGSWSYVIAEDDCIRTREVVEIAAGETREIDGIEWLEDTDVSLEPGRYRWDVAFYLDQMSLGVYGRRLFGEVFEYEDRQEAPGLSEKLSGSLWYIGIGVVLVLAAFGIVWWMRKRRRA